MTAQLLSPGAESLRIRRSLSLTLPLSLLAGFLAQDGLPGSVAAVVPLILLAALCLWQHKNRWNATAFVLATLAGGSIIAIFIEPGPLNLAISWVLLGSLSLNQNKGNVANLASTLRLLIARLVTSPFRFIKDLHFLRRMGKRTPAASRRFNWRHIFLPVAAGLFFTALLMEANPLIDAMVRGLSLLQAFDILWTWAPLAAALTAVLIWAIFRIRKSRTLDTDAIELPAPKWHHAYFAPASVAATLVILNVMFLAENALDIHYIWSAATLPPGMSYADYVHRGAYTLIVTALMAAALIIFALWPGSRTAESKSVRALVYLWIAQNVLLVASSAHRTFDYIDAYGMTEMRLYGLIWMGLVAVGLLLIGARIIFARGNLWLLNANILAAFAVLWCASFIDFRAIVANSNIERSLRLGTTGLPLDTCYLDSLGPSALPAVRHFADATLSRSDLPIGQSLFYAHQSANELFGKLQDGLRVQQSNWRSWTLRGWWIARSVS